MLKVPLGVSTAVFIAEISWSAFELGIKVLFLVRLQEWNFVVLSSNTSLYCCTLSGRVIWQPDHLNQHTYPQGARRNHCRHSAEYPIIPGNNYSTGSSPSAQLILVSLLFLNCRPQKSYGVADCLIAYNLKRNCFFFCSRVCLHTLDIRFSQSCCTLDVPCSKETPSFT